MSVREAKKHALFLRPAQMGDREMIFLWRNDPWIVAKGTLNRQVSREEHEKWFSKVLLRDCVLMNIIELDGKPVGQIRFSKQDGGVWEISLYLLKEYTGQGFGVEAIRRGCRDLFSSRKADVILAHVLEKNEASSKAFVKAGFQKRLPRNSLNQGIEGHITYYLEGNHEA